MTEQKKTREPLFHLVKRINVPTWQAWAIRGGTIVGGFLLIGILIYAFLGIAPTAAYKYMFEGAFGSRYRVMVLLRELAILLLFALAVTPAFKMKFWNIGAEGQVLMGAYACMVCEMFTVFVGAILYILCCNIVMLLMHDRSLQSNLQGICVVC